MVPIVGAWPWGAAALTFAYLARFWFCVFAGRRRISCRQGGPLLVARSSSSPPSRWPAGASSSRSLRTAESAAAATVGQPIDVSPA